MSFENSVITSIFGRRLGLQPVTTSVFGSTVGPQNTLTGRVGEFLNGPEAIRMAVTTAASSDVSLPSWGLSGVSTASVAATTNTMYTLDRPIAGVTKFLTWVSTNTATNEVSVWASSDASITIDTTQGTTLCVMRSTANFAGTIQLIGVSSAKWSVVGLLSSGAISMTTKCT